MVDAKRRYHREKVELEADGEREAVFRYLKTCRRCGWFTGEGRHGRGRCHLYDKPTHGGTTKCDDFDADEATLTEMWLETEVREGRLCKITYKGSPYYMDKATLIRAIGFDPDGSPFASDPPKQD